MMTPQVAVTKRMAFDSIPDVVEELRQGKMVIIVDDEARENEGDLLMAASLVRPQDINFMTRHGRGLVCLTLTRERCRQLNLPLMVGETDASRTTNFTVSIEAREGVTTGISAYDRAHTIRTAVAPDARPGDLKQPGHIFPVMAQPGGVLTRAGHTEAGCDLARLADLEPAAVIVEILNEDGSMARRNDLERFAQRHGLRIGTIEDLIRYRLEHEKTVRRVAAGFLDTEYGRFKIHAYEDTIAHGVHLAVVKGEIGPDEPTLVRVHIENTLCDVLLARGARYHWPIHKAMRRIAEEGRGVAILLRLPIPPQDIIKQVEETRSAVSVEDEDQSGGLEHQRTLGIGSQILADLGVRQMRLLSTRKRYHGLGGFGLEIVEYISD
jgi:3,4-dihydroxy 2-butanone 4-phosphate synthase/GTP cyclohydrolase II